VQSAYDTNRERALAQLILDRFGNAVLAQVEVRRSYIDGLSPQDAIAACERLGLKQTASSAHGDLQRVFNGAFTDTRARQFVAIFDLPEDLIPPRNIDERTASEPITAEFGEKVSLKGYLHPYQKRLKDELMSALQTGSRKLMAQMPTGAGKTVTALELVVDKLRQPGFDRLVIWAVNSNELAEQALQAFSSLWKVRGDHPTWAHRFFQGFTTDFNACPSGVVFLGFDTAFAALTSSDEDKRRQISSLARRAALIIVDEAHSSIAETYEATIRALTDRDAPLVGLSATPGRNDPIQNIELARLYGNSLISITADDGKAVRDSIDYLRTKGYLASIVFENLESGASSVQVQEGRICSELAENGERNAQILKQIERADELGDATLVFACTHDHVLALMALCRAKGISAGFIIGETTPAERASLLQRFRAGELRVILNLEILSTGIDLPNINRLIITRPVGSPILYSQILGRALRGPKNGGNTENTVVNIQDNLLNYPSASHVYESFRLTFGKE
jgi:superfamily II DNA or RNA helicase